MRLFLLRCRFAFIFSLLRNKFEVKSYSGFYSIFHVTLLRQVAKFIGNEVHSFEVQVETRHKTCAPQASSLNSKERYFYA